MTHNNTSTPHSFNVQGLIQDWGHAPQGNFEKFTPLKGNFKAFQVNNNNSINNNK